MIPPVLLNNRKSNCPNLLEHLEMREFRLIGWHWDSLRIGARVQREKGIDRSLTVEERERWNYSSQPTQNPFVRFRLLGFLFSGNFVRFDFHSLDGNVYKGTQIIKLEIRERKRVESQEMKVDEDGVVILKVQKPIPFEELKIEMMEKIGDQILRVSSLKVNGFFLAESKVINK
jgi:hypothetical protein